MGLLVVEQCVQMALVIPAVLLLEADWRVRVEVDGATEVLTLDPPELITVLAEQITGLPLYDSKAAAYARGYKLASVRAQECSAHHALDPASLVVCDLSGTITYKRGKDYEVEDDWGCLGRLENGALGPNTPVVVRYVYGLMRLDTVVQAPGPRILLRKGVSHLSLPIAPVPAAGEIRLANIWVPARVAKLDKAHLFPVSETSYPEAPKRSPSVAEQLLPKTMAKIQTGQPIRILAWGDSVTDGGYLPERERHRWQAQFAQRLQQRFPAARFELITEAWGGRNTDSYRNEPPGSPHNYKEKVLDVRPDLIVSEFVNDAGFNKDGVYQRYGRIRDEFREMGAEWIVLTPHYVRTDWMGLSSEQNIDDDPRPYVQALRTFAAENGIALADASLRWGRLWRQGIPYSTLLMNNINHPNPDGMRLYADALMALFPEITTKGESHP